VESLTIIQSRRHTINTLNHAVLLPIALALLVRGIAVPAVSIEAMEKPIKAIEEI
jgi:hypothetical protein